MKLCDQFIYCKIILIVILLLPFHQYAFGSQNERASKKAEMRCKESLDRRDYKALKHDSEILIDLANAERDVLYLGYGYFYESTCRLMIGDTLDVRKDLNFAYNIGKKIGNSNLIGKCLISLAIFEGEFSKNYPLSMFYLYRAMNLPGFETVANSNFAHIAYLAKDTLGLRYARKVLYDGIKKEDKRKIYSGLRICAQLHSVTNSSDSVYKYLNEALAVARKMNFTDTLELYIIMSRQFTKEGKYKSALTVLNDIYPKIKQSQPLYTSQVLFDIAYNHTKVNNYSASLDTLFLLKSGKSFLGEIAENDIYELIAENYKGLQCPDSTIKYLYKALNTKSEKEAFDPMNNQLQVYDTVLRTDALYQKSLEKSHRHRIVIWTLAFILTLFEIAVGYLIINRRKKNNLRKVIVKAKTEQANDVKSDNPVLADLYQRLNILMVEEKPYLNPTLTREQIISKLNTNSDYLTQIIRNYAGKSYPQYINSLRIKAAISILNDTLEDGTSSKDIAKRVGFYSISTFYRVFQDETGMTPSQFRKMSKTLETNS